MTLRTKLVFALMLAALLPMLVAVGVSVLRAESRARELGAKRLEAVRRQAGVLVERFRRETGFRVVQAAADLASDRTAFESLLGASRPAARDIARRLGEVHGLDRLEILDSTGIVLSTSRGDRGVGMPGPLAELPVGEPAVRRLSSDSADPGHLGDGPGLLVAAARHAAVHGDETLTIVGVRIIGEDTLTEIAEVTGERVSLIDPEGTAALTSPPSPTATRPFDLISGEVPLGEEGWRVRVAARAGDVRETRRELMAIFAGIAPFALASALIIGVVLAEGFSRPIRALAMRADEISAENREPFSVPPERSEVRRLTVSFDRMLEALSESARRRVAAERLAAWQDVARRIAHEVKNPLSPIKLAVENLRRTRARSPADFDRALEEESATILEEVESLRRLVDEFSQFARLPRPQMVPCDPREIVSQALALFAPRFEASRIEVHCDFEPGAPRSVLADPEQIGRVLKNVLANALDALAPVQDRRLFLAVREGRGRISDPSGRISDSGEFVEIDVRDNGAGFEPGVEGRIFEPYFTTRADSGGTGLGMAIAHRIVTDHGGTIHARGSPGRGATITIRLPVRG